MGGKYKNLTPEQAAEAAFNNLLEKVPQMIQNYQQAMYELPSKRNDYVSKVALWISVMRQPEVRDAISNAVQQAKQKLRQRIFGITRPIAPMITR